MEGTGTAILIPDSLSNLRFDGHYTYMRHIGPADSDISSYLAFLIGVIDTGSLEQVNADILRDIWKEQKCASLLEFCRANGNVILQHHRFHDFLYIQDALMTAATRLKDAIQGNFDRLQVPFEYAGSLPLPQAKFGIFTHRNEYFTLYPDNTIPLDTILCCGCRYSPLIYQHSASDFPTFCTHHSQATLQQMLWESSPEPCEETYQELILTGHPLPECRKCSRKSYLSVLVTVCNNGCSYCLDCLSSSINQLKQICPGCGGMLMMEKLNAVPQITTQVLGNMQLELGKVYRGCSNCGGNTIYPLLFTESPHAQCAWCPSCSLSFCLDCRRNYIDTEKTALNGLKTTNCQVCFAGHECEAACLLCFSATQYSQTFALRDCGYCKTPITPLAQCPQCRGSTKPQNMSTYGDSQICGMCAQELYQVDKQLVEEAKVEELPEPAPPLPSQPLPLTETPGNEFLESTCRDCGIRMEVTERHECTQSCDWCFAKSMIQSDHREYCLKCGKSAWELKKTLLLFCESCDKTFHASDFLHRSRCRAHQICITCACKSLRESNGQSACRFCVSDPMDRGLEICLHCGQNHASAYVHRDKSTHPICWVCAIRSQPATANICSCKVSSTDRFREALLFEHNSRCFTCKRLRPLYTSRCNCSVGLCAYCIPADGKCPHCGIEKSPPVDWINNEKQDCVECLDTQSYLISRPCGHFFHPNCSERVKNCPVCLRLPSA